MKNFYRGNNKFSGGRDFKRQDFDRRDSSDRSSMHRTTCSECGNSCEVPFVPSGAKPVYCSKCFEQHRGGESKRFEGRNSAPRYNNYSENRNDKQNTASEGQYKKQFESLNWKVDKILKILSPAVAAEVVVEKSEIKVSTEIKPKKIIAVSKKKKPAVIKKDSE